MAKQQRFSFITSSRLNHGGELAKGRRKTERPLKTNKPIHVVLRARRAGLKISRVANWGKDYQILARYILKNQLETLELISYVPRTG